MLYIIMTYLGVGVIAGILAGLFGIGGGLIIVPMLVICLAWMQVLQRPVIGLSPLYANTKKPGISL